MFRFCRRTVVRAVSMGGEICRVFWRSRFYPVWYLSAPGRRARRGSLRTLHPWLLRAPVRQHRPDYCNRNNATLRLPASGQSIAAGCLSRRRLSCVDVCPRGLSHRRKWSRIRYVVLRLYGRCTSVGAAHHSPLASSIFSLRRHDLGCFTRGKRRFLRVAFERCATRYCAGLPAETS